MRSTWAGCVFLLAIMSSGSGVARAADANRDWPCWLGPNHDGKSPDKGLLKEWPAAGPTLLWKAESIGKGFSSPSVSGGMVYVTGDVGDNLVLFAFDANGNPKWKMEHGPAGNLDHPGARSTPTVDGNAVYLLSPGGLIACYNAKTGQRGWTKEMKELGGRAPQWGYAESVLIYENLAIVTPGGQGCVAALDKTSGRPVWGSQGFNAPAHYGSVIPFVFERVPMLAAGTGGGLVSVNPKNGAVLWSNGFSANNTANCPSPAYSDGHVFWANGYGKGGICMKLAVSGDRVTATKAWETKDMVCHHGGYIIDNGFIYGNNGGGWACLDLKTGEKKWSDKGVGKGSLCYADGMLYLFSESKGAAALATCSPDGLKITGRVSVAGTGESWAHPVVIGGRLYLRYDTTLYCFDVKAK